MLRGASLLDVGVDAIVMIHLWQYKQVIDHVMLGKGRRIRQKTRDSNSYENPLLDNL